MSNKSLTFKNYFCYGMGDVFGGGAFALIGSFFLIFLTNNVGISPILAGFVFGFGRLWMAFSDPLMGMISDRTKSRFGRRRVYFLAGFVPIIITFIPLWLTPIKVGVNGGTELTAFLYYLVMYCLFDIVYSVIVTPYVALLADMTYQYQERVKLSAFRMGFSQFASILATAVAPIMLGIMSYSDEAYAIMATTFAIVFSVIWLFVFWGTHEIKHQTEVTPERKLKTSLFKKLGIFISSFGSSFQNKSFRAQLGVFLFAFAALDILMGFSAYFVNIYLKNPSLLPYVSAMWVSQVCVLPIYVLIANKFSKAVAYRIGGIIWICAMLMMLTLTPNSANPANMIFHFALIGIGLSPCYMIPMAMLSFVTEVDFLMTKKRRTGVYAGALSFARKLSQGIFILPGLGLILSLIGYQKGIEVQSVTTVYDLRLVFVFIPILFILIGLFFSLKFHINPQNFRIIKNEISRLNSGGSKKDVDSKTKMVCELLTGKKYEQLY